MSADAHGVARDQLRAFVQRVERVEEEIKTLNDDKSDIYKEARAMGFDVKVLRKVVAKRKIDKDERDEQDAIFDMYWDALHGAGHVHVHPHARENIEEFPASDGSPSVSSELTTRLPEGSVVPHSPETAPVPSSEQSEGNGSRDHQHVHSRQADGAKHGGQDGEPAGADHASNPDQPLTGGDHEVDGNALRVPTSNTGEDAANTALPAKSLEAAE